MDSPLIVSLIVALVINISMFLVAYQLKSDKLTDISYAVTFIAIALVAFVQSNRDFYHILLLAMVIIWGVRLGGFLLYRVIKKGKDVRFDGTRESFVKFGIFWLTQAVTVWILMIPSIFAFDATSSINALVLIGLLVWLIGLGVETTADVEKIKFGQNQNNKNPWIEQGLWKYSRHPNYFGEILVWIGIYMYAVSSLSGVQMIVGLASPIFITILLLFISGIPILEKSADRKWGKTRAYIIYKKRTSLLIPLPPKKLTD